MSKECLNVRDARVKLQFSGEVPGPSNEIVTREQCLAMRASAVPLQKYATAWDCPADDDIVPGVIKTIGIVISMCVNGGPQNTDGFAPYATLINSDEISEI